MIAWCKFGRKWLCWSAIMNRLRKNMRLIRLVEILKNNQHYKTAAVLAKELGVTERTIYRDLDDLSILGFPLYVDRGYKMHKEPPLTSMSLTEADVRLLHLFLKSSPLHNHDGYRNQIDFLIEKLQSLSSFHHDVDAVPIHSGETAPAFHQSLEMRDLEKAVNERCVSKVLYHSLEDREPYWRLLHPHAMVIREGKWYLIARDATNQEIRLYRMERIHTFELTTETFERDPHFSMDQYFEGSWSVFRGEKQKVRLWVKDIALRIIQERHWIKPQSWNPISDHEAECTIMVQGTTEISAWVLSMGPNAEILEPKSLRDQVRAALAETLKKYEMD